jgi:hypothetical protein
MPVIVSTQPAASVTIAEYVPACRFVAVAVVCTGVVFHVYENGGVPPATATVLAPVAVPKQFAGVVATMADRLLGCVTVTEAVATHPFASVTLTE